MSWLDDGTPVCADSDATFADTPLYTMFSLNGVATTNRIDIDVGTVLAPGPIVGSYACVPLDSLSVSFLYTLGQAAMTCEITLNMQGTPGVHATGTFSATLWPADGGTKMITNGVFDAPVTFLGGN